MVTQLAAGRREERARELFGHKIVPRYAVVMDRVMKRNGFRWL